MCCVAKLFRVEAISPLVLLCVQQQELLDSMPPASQLRGSSCADRQWSGLVNSQSTPDIAKVCKQADSPAPTAPSPFASQQAQERAYSDTLTSVGGLPGALR